MIEFEGGGAYFFYLFSTFSLLLNTTVLKVGQECCCRIDKKVLHFMGKDESFLYVVVTKVIFTRLILLKLISEKCPFVRKYFDFTRGQKIFI